jgi:hypothetical protein
MHLQFEGYNVKQAIIGACMADMEWCIPASRNGLEIYYFNRRLTPSLLSFSIGDIDTIIVVLPSVHLPLQPLVCFCIPLLVRDATVPHA